MGNVLSLTGFIGTPIAVGAIIGTKMAPEIKGWYKTIKKPSWNPPNYLFAPVWTTLYSMIGYAAYRIFSVTGLSGGAVPLGLYTTQLILNFLWSPIFFNMHNLKLACIDITAMLGFIAATIYEFNKVDQTAALLMVPYLGWVSFAAALTYSIYNLNKDSPIKKTK
jgi:translocator protein